MARILVAIDGPLFGSNGEMAGLQVRVFEMARALVRAGHNVVVLEGLPSVRRFDEDNFRLMGPREARQLSFDVWIAAPFVFHRFRRAFAKLPYILDGYEAPFDSFLANAAAAGPAQRAAWLGFRAQVTRYFNALLFADFVIAANDAQRGLYRALLCVLGRLGPSRADDDLTLLLHSGPPFDIVPNNADAVAPWRAMLSAPVFLWAGGVYPWIDIATFVRAIPRLTERLPTASILFTRLAGVAEAGHPACETLSDALKAKRAPAALLPYAAELRPLAHRIFVAPSLAYRWTTIPFGAADVLVCCYHVGLFTAYSMRTRVLDAVGSGVPMVLTARDPLAELLERRGAARTVPAGAAEALAQALIELGEQPELRGRMSRAALSVAREELSWDIQVRTLSTVCTQLLSTAPNRTRDPRLMTPRGALRIGAEEWIDRIGRGLRRRALRLCRGSVGT